MLSRTVGATARSGVIRAGRMIDVRRSGVSNGGDLTRRVRPFSSLSLSSSSSATGADRQCRAPASPDAARAGHDQTPFGLASCRFSSASTSASTSSSSRSVPADIHLHARQRRYLSTAAAAESTTEDDDDDALTAARRLPYEIKRRSGVRNVAIVAHVDHGKTTLVDGLLRAAEQSSLPGAESSAAAAAAARGTATDPSTSDNRNVEEEVSASSSERLLDSGELEIERGITITSKVTRLDYHPRRPNSTPCTPSSSSVVINVVDTPGHADFAGEVDRILGTVDGVVLLVDAAEGPMAQTKYVLGRALRLGLVPLVVYNKCDRSDGVTKIESGETESDVLDLFDALGASEEQMHYGTLYASARGGWVTEDIDVALGIAKHGLSGGSSRGSDGSSQQAVGMEVLLDAILDHIPPPAVHSYKHKHEGGAVEEEVEEEGSADDFADDKFSMAATTVGYDQYLGRTCTGRIYSGSVGVNDSVSVLRREDSNEGSDATSDAASSSPGASAATGGALPTSNVAGLFVNRGVSRTPLESSVAVAGDIVTVAGVPDSISVGDTLTSTSNPVPHPIDTPPVAPPTLSMDFGPNTGPLVGKEGSIVTSSRIRSRLIDETDNNVTIAVTKSDTDAEKTVVYGRGELQLGILVEQMRREGYEMCVSPPRIVTKTCPDTGKKLEPYEEVIVDVDAHHSGTVVNSLTGARKGVLIDMTENAADGKTRLTFDVPSRGLLGFGPDVATATRGTAVVHHCYVDDRPYAGALGLGLDKGKLVSNESGKASLYALSSLSDRGVLFVEPGDEVYEGMVVGERKEPGDLDVNPVRAKQATNIRTVNKDDKMFLAPAKRRSVEELIGYMREDEVIEVTPKSVRLRKAELDAGARQRAARSLKKREKALREAKQGGGGKKR